MYLINQVRALLKATFVPFMLLSIDPLVYIVHAYDAKESALHERHVHMEPSVGLRQRAALNRDGEWVTCMLWCASCVDPPSPPPLS